MLLSTHHFSLPRSVELCSDYHTTLLGLLQKETPCSTLRKRWNGNLGLRKVWRPLFSEEAENLNSSFQNELKSGPAGLSIKELGCSPVKQDGETMAPEGAQVTPQPSCSPAQQRKDRHQPAPQAQRSTEALGLLRSPH